ncbi:MAG: molybdopterin-dependent oxidoreductase, partial [bacterium]
MDQPFLRIDGLVAEAQVLTRQQLEALPDSAQVLDVSRFEAKKQGDAVTLDSLLSLAGVLPEANYMTLHAGRDDFHVSVPLDAVRAEGLLIYKIGNDDLAVSQGGPFRFLIR